MKDGVPELALKMVAERLVARAGRRRVWLAPELPPTFSTLDLNRVDTPALAEMALIRAPRLGPRGEILGPPEGVGLPGKVWAWFEPSNGDRILGKADGHRRGRASRLFSPQGFIEVRPAGLVIVELAKGVSARDLQTYSDPPLLIDPGVVEMGFSPTADGPHDADHGVA